MAKIKISVVDDDEFVLQAMGHLIRSLGYEVELFLSAKDFLACTRGRGTSCVISDLQMPGITGIDLQRRLLADGCPTPLIFMSGNSDEKIRADLMTTGAIGFLHKPVDVDRLVELLNKALSF